MLTGLKRASVALQLQIAILKVGKGKADARTWSALLWQPQPLWQGILWMYVPFN
jgi:hypothetical protein